MNTTVDVITAANAASFTISTAAAIAHECRCICYRMPMHTYVSSVLPMHGISAIVIATAIAIGIEIDIATVIAAITSTFTGITIVIASPRQWIIYLSEHLTL
jgi:hypothetical protein